MHGFLKEDLYFQNENLDQFVKEIDSSVYTLKELKNLVDSFSNKFEIMPKGTKFVLNHYSSLQLSGPPSGIYCQTHQNVGVWTKCNSFWESEDGKIKNKCQDWADGHLIQHEDPYEEINITTDDFRIDISFSQKSKKINVYRRKPFFEFVGNKNYLLYKDINNGFDAWTIVHYEFVFKHDEEEKLNKVFKMIKEV